MKHSVILDTKKCRGCTTCVKACPTEAIRVVRGKAVIFDDKCIDCGRCVKVCPHHAKKVACDSFDRLSDYRYNIALPSTPLYGQFRNLKSIDFVLNALLNIGFDQVFEVSRASEMLSDYRDRLGDAHPLWQGEYPRISSACPAIVRLIAHRFPHLVDNVSPELCSFELAAIIARRQAVEKTGLKPEEIGVCYITPCPAEATMAYRHIDHDKPLVDYVLSMDEVYVRLLSEIPKIDKPEKLCKTGMDGLQWARSGGQGFILDHKICLGVDGINNVMDILDDVEDDKVTEAELIEADACVQGCFGGCLTVENPFTATLRMRWLVEDLPKRANIMAEGDEDLVILDKPLEPDSTNYFSDDLALSLSISQQADNVYKRLPHFDCGSCGAPSCRAFADDVAMGIAPIDDCIFNLMKKQRAQSSGDDFIPLPFRKAKED